MLTVVVVIVGVIPVIAVAGEMVGWMKREQTASSDGPDPWPCHSSAFGSSGFSAGSGPLLQRNTRQRKRVRIERIYTYSLTQDEGFCETPPQSESLASATCSEVPKSWSVGGNGSNSWCLARY